MAARLDAKLCSVVDHLDNCTHQLQMAWDLVDASVLSINGLTQNVGGVLVSIAFKFNTMIQHKSIERCLEI